MSDSFDPSFEDDSTTEVDGKEKGGGHEDEDDNINTAKVFENGSEGNDAETKLSLNRQRRQK